MEQKQMVNKHVTAITSLSLDNHASLITISTVSPETRNDMMSLSVPELSFQDASRRDSGVQVNLMPEPSPTPSLSRSEIGIQADVPAERDIEIKGKGT